MMTTQTDRRTSAVTTPSVEQGTTQTRGVGRFNFRTFSSLRYRDYRLLWIGVLFMSAGQWVQQVTLGWLLYDMTGSSVLLGALNGLRSIPFLIAGPLAGVAADRMDRRRLLMNTQSILVVTAFIMGTLVATGRAEVWHLFVFTLITGIGWAFNQPVRQSLVPTLVPREALMNAVALSAAGINLTKVIGPTLGGLLIALFGASGNFFVQGTAYAAVFVMISMMVVPPAPQRAQRSSALADLKEGLSYVRSDRLMLALLSSSLVMTVLAMPYQALMPVFQKDVLGVGPEGLGFLLGAPGIGALITTLLLASFSNIVRRKGLLLLAGLVFLGVCLILFSRTTSLPLALLALVGVGSGHLTVLTTNMTIVQLLVPDALRGRVMSISFLDRGLAPVGALLAGVLTHYIGAPATVALMGSLVVLLAIFVAWVAPHLRRLET